MVIVCTLHANIHALNLLIFCLNKCYIAITEVMCASIISLCGTETKLLSCILLAFCSYTF